MKDLKNVSIDKVHAVAINAIHLCKTPGQKNDQGKVIKPAVVEVQAPGSTFEVDKKQFDEFKALGAVREASEAEATAFKAAQPAAAE